MTTNDTSISLHVFLKLLNTNFIADQPQTFYTLAKRHTEIVIYSLGTIMTVFKLRDSNNYSKD